MTLILLLKYKTKMGRGSRASNLPPEAIGHGLLCWERVVTEAGFSVEVFDPDIYSKREP